MIALGTQPNLSVSTQQKLAQAASLFIAGKLTEAAFRVRCDAIIEKGGDMNDK